jgi:hypothetical protein
MHCTSDFRRVEKLKSRRVIADNRYMAVCYRLESLNAESQNATSPGRRKENWRLIHIHLFICVYIEIEIQILQSPASYLSTPSALLSLSPIMWTMLLQLVRC